MQLWFSTRSAIRKHLACLARRRSARSFTSPHYADSSSSSNPRICDVDAVTGRAINLFRMYSDTGGVRLQFGFTRAHAVLLRTISVPLAFDLNLSLTALYRTANRRTFFYLLRLSTRYLKKTARKAKFINEFHSKNNKFISVNLLM